MAENILMLALSPTMETGQIVKWHKKVGDKVSSGDVICEVETDKAVMEYESIQEGILLKILVPEGGSASVGEPIGIIGEAGEKLQDSSAEPPASKPSEPQSVEKPVELTPARPVQVKLPVIEPTVPAQREEGVIHASPLARKLAGEKGIDLSSISGSGPGGRIIKRDVEQFQGEKSPVPAGAASKTPPAPPVQPPVVEKPAQGVTHNIPLTGKRRITAERLSESKFTAPHYYLRIAVRMDELMKARERANSRLPEKISLNAFIMKFTAETLKSHPMVNSSWNGDAITLFGNIDLGLAVSVSDGLIVPVVRDCGGKGIIGIDRELQDLIPRARSGGLKPEEYKGATFTISNLGNYGIEEFTAIINPPGSAILALGAIQKEPFVEDNDTITIRKIMKMTLSCDHRVIDGAAGAAFMRDLKDLIEYPLNAMM